MVRPASQSVADMRSLACLTLHCRPVHAADSANQPLINESTSINSDRKYSSTSTAGAPTGVGAGLLPKTRFVVGVCIAISCGVIGSGQYGVLQEGAVWEYKYVLTL